MFSMTSDTKGQIYKAALEELEKLQREMNFEQTVLRRQHNRKNTLIVGSLMLSALMSGLATHAYLPSPNRPLSVAESEAIGSLISYVSLKTSISKAGVQLALLRHLEAMQLNELQATDYDEAIAYLLSLAS